MQTSRQAVGTLCLFDGDWCWDLHPFVVTEEHKRMVVRNISFLLRSFLENAAIHTVIFCWVIPQEEIFAQLLNPLEDLSFPAIPFYSAPG